jgi:hypothetical protein
MASFRFTKEKEIVFHDKVNDAYNHVEANHERLGVPDPAPVLKAKLDNYNTKHEAAGATDRKKTAPAERQAARKTLTDAFKAYGEEHLFHNPRLTPEDKAMAHIHEDKTTRTSIVPPNILPIVIVVLAVIRQITFKYYAHPDASHMGKPPKVAKFVVYYLISDTPPKSVAELVHKVTSSDPPLVMNFRDEDRGKRLYYVTCWAIAHNDLEGPKSQIEFVIIP